MTRKIQHAEDKARRLSLRTHTKPAILWAIRTKILSETLREGASHNRNRKGTKID